MQLMIMILLLCLIIFITTLFFKKHPTSNTPPSPRGLPLIGNLHQLGRHPHRSLTSLSHRYGPLMLIHLGRVPVLVVSSAKAAKDVLKTHDRVFASRPQLKIFEKLLYHARDVVLAPYGDYWRQMKSVCVLRLLSNKMVRSYRGVREQEIALTMEKIHQGDRRDGNDFVDVLLSIQRENSLGFEMDNMSMKVIVLDVFVGGMDTSYTLIEWTMTELLHHPECLNKLQEEVRTICKDISSVSEDDLRDMNYLKAVIKETLRLHPPLPLMVPHESTQDVMLQDYHIPAGTQLIINAWAIGREASTWGLDANEFRPERHFDSCFDFRVHRFDWRLPVDSREIRTNVAESTGVAIHRLSPLYAIASSSSSTSLT
ncbi:unnamed protein product [Cochlearia groenlandica]